MYCDINLIWKINFTHFFWLSNQFSKSTERLWKQKVERVSRLSYFHRPMLVCILFPWAPRLLHSVWQTPMPFHNQPAYTHYIQNFSNIFKSKQQETILEVLPNAPFVYLVKAIATTHSCSERWTRIKAKSSSSHDPGFKEKNLEQENVIKVLQKILSG